MKKNYILLCLLWSMITYGQENIQEVLEQDVCFCVDKQTKSRLNPRDVSILKSCLRSKIWHYSQEFKATLEEEHFIEKADNLYKYDINLNNLSLFIAGHLEFFIQECDIYYLYSSAIRIQELSNMRLYDYKKKIESLTKKINRSKQKSEWYYQRGMQYLAQGRYKEAKQDFYKCQENKLYYDKATYALGWTCELNEEYGVAMGWYKQLAKANNDRDAATGFEITKRKVKDKEAFESLKYSVGFSLLLEAFNDKEREILADTYTVPVIKTCNGLTGNDAIEKCMYTVVKNHVQKNLNLRSVMNYSNLETGNYEILTSFTISKGGNVTDVKVLFNDPFVVYEIKKGLNSLPTMKPAMSAEGEPIETVYSIPVNFYVRNSMHY